jgi:O-antigen ligase
LNQTSKIAAAPNAAMVKAPKWQSYVWIIALLPFIQAILTWDLDGKLSAMNYAIRHLSIPAIAGELLIIIFAIISGASIRAMWRPIAPSVKLIVAIWFLFALAASLLNAGNRLDSVFSFSRYFVHGLFFAAIVHLIRKATVLSDDYWLKIITFGVTAYVAFLTIFALVVPDPANFDWALRMPSATNIRQIANIAAIPAAAAIALLLYSNQTPKYQSAAIVFVVVAFIAWSGSRTALFAIILSTFAALIFVRKMPTLKALTSLAGSFAAGLGFSMLLPAPSPMFGLLRMFDKMRETDNVSSGRVQFWFDTFDQVAKSPWLGHGSGHFRANMNEIYGISFNHPHNFILQFSYDWGIFGAAAAIALIALLLVMIWKTAPAHPLSGFAAASGCLTLLAIAMVDGALFYPLTIIAAISLVAPIAAKWHSPERASDSL